MRKLVTEGKPLASLSSGLLARKGQARPAMRPQGFGSSFGLTAAGQDDLGWNDMGYDPPQPHEEPEASTPSPAPVTPISLATVPPEMKPSFVPLVLRQREELAEEFAPVAPEPAIVPAIEPAPAPEVEPLPAPEQSTIAPFVKPISLATAARIGRETAARDNKAAFTLRLDTARHLRLRLASAIRNESAQTLVTQALDQFLKTVPEAEDLARQLPEPRAARANSKR